MRRFFVKNLLFVIIVNLLVKPVWVLLIDRTVQNRVGHAEYGTYQALLNLAIIFNIVLDLGLTYYNTRIISGKPTKLRTLFPAILSARLVLIIAYSIIVFIIGLSIGYTSRELLLLVGVLFIQSFNSLVLFFRGNVSSLQKFKVDAVLSVTDRLLMIAICGFLLFYPTTAEKFKIEWFVITQIISYSITIIIGYIVLKRITKTKLSFSFDLAEVIKIIRQGLPYASLVFLMSIHMRSDTILVERLSGEDSKTYAGIYAAAYRLLDVGNMFGIMFSGMLLPLFGRMLSQNKDIQPIIRVSVNLLLPAAYIVSIACIYFGLDIMQLLYVHTNEDSGKVLAWLMGCFPAYCIMYIHSTLLTANNNLKLLNRIALTGVIINLSMNLILIPQMNALGAAITAFTTQITLAACYIIFSGSKLGLRKDIKWILAHAGFIVGTLITGYLFTLTDWDWLYQLSAYAVVCFMMIFIFKFISINSVKVLLKNR